MPEVYEKAKSNWREMRPKLNKQCWQENWILHELKPNYVERRFSRCKMLFTRHKRKVFLNRVVTGDEQWFYYINQKKSSRIFMERIHHLIFGVLYWPCSNKNWWDWAEHSEKSFTLGFAKSILWTFLCFSVSQSLLEDLSLRHHRCLYNRVYSQQTTFPPFISKNQSPNKTQQAVLWLERCFFHQNTH